MRPVILIPVIPSYSNAQKHPSRKEGTLFHVWFHLLTLWIQQQQQQASQWAVLLGLGLSYPPAVLSRCSNWTFSFAFLSPDCSTPNPDLSALQGTLNHRGDYNTLPEINFDSLMVAAGKMSMRRWKWVNAMRFSLCVYSACPLLHVELTHSTKEEPRSKEMIQDDIVRTTLYWHITM